MVCEEQARMLLSNTRTTVIVATLFAMGMALYFNQVEPNRWIAVWAALKVIGAAPRLVQEWTYRRVKGDIGPRWLHWIAALLFIDGLSWGTAAVWLLLSPNLMLHALLVGSLASVAALGAFTLQADFVCCLALVLPMLTPAVTLSIFRGDSFGAFVGLGLAAFVFVMLNEAARARRRIVELLCLRFNTDLISHERAQALELAQRHSAVKSQFLATMSHEMRTPLHGILGMTRLLKRNNQDPLADQQLGLVERSGEHLLAVINDILDFSKIEAGRMKLDSADFNLLALLEDVVTLSGVTSSAKGLRLDIRIDLDRPCYVHGDPARVRQILLNLMGNAIKFTDQGMVRLRVWREPGTGPDTPGPVKMSVEDSGLGIAAEDLPKIFEAFQQADSSFGRRFAGTGLGLTISRELARAMGGDITCSSVEGKGSVFSLTLPLPPVSAPANEPDPTVLAMVPEKIKLQGLVLLAEDNAVNAMLAEAVLRRVGLDVEIVPDGEKAVERMQQASQPTVDIILMDCQMPNMDGFEATRRIRALEQEHGLPRTPIVALTANALQGDRDRCLDCGMDDHLSKPFKEEQLVRMLFRYLPQARMEPPSLTAVGPAGSQSKPQSASSQS
jgi:signal transduction histidine kinase/DNA-binding NarL/FixJ family response regulator